MKFSLGMQIKMEVKKTILLFSLEIKMNILKLKKDLNLPKI